MSRLKHKLLLVLMTCLLTTSIVRAQSNGINSSYSRFGLGLPTDLSQGYNRSMGGVAQGLRASYRINMQNPASYSAIDSLTFLFDVGMGLNRTYMSQGSTKKSLNNTSFEYVNAAFRLRRHLGMSVGFMPYTNIGYQFSNAKNIGQDNTNEMITQQMDFSSSDEQNMQNTGGLHQVYVGAGWMPFNGFSFGANLGFLWGNINHKIIQTFSQNGSTVSSDGSLSTYYLSSIKTWKGDVGVQYQTILNSANRLTLGATVGIGHTIGSEAQYITSNNSSTDTLSTRNGYEIPMTYSIGAAWEYAEKWTVAADFAWEQWGNCTTPQYNAQTNSYNAATGAYKDRYSFHLGAEYVPARYDRSFRSRINYRMGAYYSSPFLKINGMDGPKELGITAGIGIPITNAWANMSYLNLYAPSYVNVGLQWTHRSPNASTMITENVFQINIGLSFNERWFMKWKFK